MEFEVKAKMALWMIKSMSALSTIQSLQFVCVSEFFMVYCLYCTNLMYKSNSLVMSYSSCIHETCHPLIEREYFHFHMMTRKVSQTLPILKFKADLNKWFSTCIVESCLNGQHHFHISNMQDICIIYILKPGLVQIAL